LAIYALHGVRLEFAIVVERELEANDSGAAQGQA
jgi:hypothetical protein